MGYDDDGTDVESRGVLDKDDANLCEAILITNSLVNGPPKFSDRLVNIWRDLLAMFGTWHLAINYRGGLMVLA